MKHLLPLIFSLVTLQAFAHEGVDLGPNGGRLLVIDKKASLKGEVRVKGDQFHLTLLDSQQKALPVTAQTLTAHSRGSIVTSTKLTVVKTSHGFTFPLVRSGAWIVMQYRAAAESKPITIRFPYDTSTCSGCQKAEWLCGCR
ncbi:hypothetical protein [Prosthecobacter dejongeii]|uniref:Uncharacterized protein n=1 Tax=Prosthecobacter dejongeii TaxID=48465 RepID=A0A7W7YK98_9BACT|nr:hypothetical protein [Prosthecobacter dejongeii]MBB5037557.1 hypothetical protein [Prosthecobacter dejongeii]